MYMYIGLVGEISISWTFIKREKMRISQQHRFFNTTILLIEDVPVHICYECMCLGEVCLSEVDRTNHAQTITQLSDSVGS